MENPQADPLLQPGSSIDPIIVEAPDVTDPKDKVEAPPHPDWLPPGWCVDYRVRASGASIGHKDKYYLDPVSQHWFRSKKEVLSYLETGIIGNGKRINTEGSDAESTPGSSKQKKKAEKINIDNFNFDDPPKKVKWVMTDFCSASWEAKMTDADGAEVAVLKSTQKEWAAAFRHMALQNKYNADA